VGGKEWGTQQENSYTKHTVTNRLPVITILGRVNEASYWNVLTKWWDKWTRLHKHSTAKCFFWRKWKESVA